MRSLSLYFTSAAALSLLAITANATPVTFSAFDTGATSAGTAPNSAAEQTALETAVTALSQTYNTILFGSDALGSFTDLTVASGVDLSGSATSVVNTPLCGAALCGFAVDDTQWVSLEGGTATFTFTTPVDAFGAWLTGVQLDGETITFSDGSSQTIDIPNAGTGVGGAVYVGFTDAGESISSITINASDDIIGVDDVLYSSAGPAESGAPEPATVGLVGVALAGIAVLRRRKTAA